MRVIYRGRLPALVTEYNGVRYSLTRGVSKDIPVRVYDNVKSSGHVMAGDLVPDVESYEREIADLKVQLEKGYSDKKEKPDGGKTRKKK